ncbi:HAD family hydrolase [Photobacterium sp. Alg240-V54]|uniref:HAD-IIIC family phosphatase n=1 Tax=Photobacterium sp. Alg240-V54 TaxID=2305995 RepID=UPI0013CFEDB0|nr:HAD-IIIC family phosphatase [Photobacterium sp. Alg240-V54]
MYQLEVLSHQDLQQAICLPDEVRQAFISGQSIIDQCVKYSVLQWEEHCTECAMPACYKTCELYQPRRDGHCRRFINGIVPLHISQRQSPVVQVDFKQWGALMSTSYIGVIAPEQAKAIDNKAALVESVAQCGQWLDGLSIAGRRGIVARMATRYKNHLSQTINPSPYFDAFMIELYCPQAIDLSIVIRATTGKLNQTPFQYRLQQPAGYHQIQIPFIDIAPHIDFQTRHFINLIPNRDENDQKTALTMVFGFIGFIQLLPQLDDHKQLPTTAKNKSVKVLVWDLDNTLWNGILVEDGEAGVELRSGVIEVIKTLDDRGIVNSIASKNDHHRVWAHLTALGIAEYFIFPEIHWQPKSQSIQRIADNFNVSIDTIAFIDDSAFERNEVNTIHPQVRIFKDNDYLKLIDLVVFNPQTSAESGLRRSFYVAQQQRITHSRSFDGQYIDFIKASRIKLSVGVAQFSNIDRVHELVQRTNQMNFSATRYDRNRLTELINDPLVTTLFLTAKDKFGDYGTVGVCIIDIQQQRVIDLMFSCRIQSKRVEHAFLGWLLDCAYLSGWKCLQVEYKPTAKNSQSASVFCDLEFKQIGQNQGVVIYSKSTTAKHVGEDLIAIEAPNIIFAKS